MHAIFSGPLTAQHSCGLLTITQHFQGLLVATKFFFSTCCPIAAVKMWQFCGKLTENYLQLFSFFVWQNGGNIFGLKVELLFKHKIADDGGFAGSLS